MIFFFVCLSSSEDSGSKFVDVDEVREEDGGVVRVVVVFEIRLGAEHWKVALNLPEHQLDASSGVFVRVVTPACSLQDDKSDDSVSFPILVWGPLSIFLRVCDRKEISILTNLLVSSARNIFQGLRSHLEKLS